MDTVAVIGVSGFVGSHVAAELLERGYAVRGALRDPDRARPWLEEALGSRGRLTLHRADVFDLDSVRAAVEGASGIVMCAGSPTNVPETIDLMVSAGRNTLAAARDAGIGRVVITSSTSSTNLPEGEPAVKQEMVHFSDADLQIAAGKYASAAKTRLDRESLATMEESGGALRVSILLPSMILGDSFAPEPPEVFGYLRRILAGEILADGAPDGSMSAIHVQDLARLHVAALEDPSASGRYFGVVRSWHWQELLETLARHAPGYEAPPWPGDRARARPTQFDFTRRDSLGVSLRDLDAMFADTLVAMQRRGLWP